MLDLGQQIKQARLKKNITQKQLAEKVNISVGTISGVESGRKTAMSSNLLELIAKELQITVWI